MTDKIEDYEEQSDIITLSDENGNDVEFEFLDLINLNDVDYAVLLPTDENEDEVVILRIEDDGEFENYVSVDDMEILDGVFNIFKERFADVFDFDC